MSLRNGRRSSIGFLPFGIASVALLLPFLATGSCSDSSPTGNGSGDGAAVDDHHLLDGAPADTVDAGDPPDASGGFPDFTTSWGHVPWAPSCALYQPGDGGLSTVPIPDWVACTSGRVGCTQIAPTWSSRSDATLPVVYERPSGASSVEAFMFREYSPYQYEYVVWDSSAGVEAAWRFNGTGKECVEIFGDIAAGEIGLTEAVYGGQTTVQEYRQVFGSAASLASKQKPDYEFTPLSIGFSSSLQMSNSSASSTVSSLEFGDIEQIGIRDRVANVVDGLDAGGGTRIDVKPFYSIVGDDLFFSSTTGLYAWTRANGLQLLMPSSTSTLEHDLVTDGTELAWVESTNPDSDGFYTSAALYTSPFTTSAAGLVPHKVMGVGCRSGLCESSMSQGYVTVGLDPINTTTHQFMLVRLTDGAHWKLTDGSTDVWGLGKVVNSELWIPAQISGSNLSVERVTLASLGAPDTD